MLNFFSIPSLTILISPLESKVFFILVAVGYDLVIVGCNLIVMGCGWFWGWVVIA